MIQAPGLCKLIKTTKNVPFHWILGEIVNLKKISSTNDLKALVDILVSLSFWLVYFFGYLTLLAT
jgi:hypothetical protein